MKIFHIFVTLFIFSNTFGQNSYYFSVPLPTDGEKVNTVDPNYFGEYTNNSSLIIYNIDALGIHLISTQISSISKELVRESSTYSVRNGYIFGVIENDSLPCVFENGRYYFGLHNKKTLCGEDNKNQLRRISSTQYLLNFFESGSYTPMLLLFSGKTMSVHELDYDPSKEEFNYISEQKSTSIDGQSIILLKPTAEECKKIIDDAFRKSIQFSRK